MLEKILTDIQLLLVVTGLVGGTSGTDAVLLSQTSI